MATVDKISTPSKSSKAAMAANIGLWVLQILLALAFLMAGGSKLAGVPMMVDMFEKLGFGQWFRYLTGGLEVIAAILLVIPRLSGFGALLLCPIMIGATLTHLIVLKDSPAPPLVLLAIAVVVVFGRRAQFLAAISPTPKPAIN